MSICIPTIIMFFQSYSLFRPWRVDSRNQPLNPDHKFSDIYQ